MDPTFGGEAYVPFVIKPDGTTRKIKIILGLIVLELNSLDSPNVCCVFVLHCGCLIIFRCSLYPVFSVINILSLNCSNQLAILWLAAPSGSHVVAGSLLVAILQMYGLPE